MNIIVSGCLLGENCKYNGGNNYNQKVIDLVMNHRVISVCPEIMAGLGAPRKCVEIVNGIIMSEDGDNLDKIFRQGVNKTLSYIEDEDIDFGLYSIGQNYTIIAPKGSSAEKYAIDNKISYQEK